MAYEMEQDKDVDILIEDDYESPTASPPTPPEQPGHF